MIFLWERTEQGKNFSFLNGQYLIPLSPVKVSQLEPSFLQPRVCYLFPPYPTQKLTKSYSD